MVVTARVQQRTVVITAIRIRAVAVVAVVITLAAPATPAAEAVRALSSFGIQRVHSPPRAARSPQVARTPSTPLRLRGRSPSRTCRLEARARHSVRPVRRVRQAPHHGRRVRPVPHHGRLVRHHRSARLRGRGQTSSISSLRAVVVVVLLPVVVAVVVDFLRTVLRSHQAPHTPSRLVEVDPVRPRPVRAPTERIVYLVLSRQSVVVVAAVM